MTFGKQRLRHPRLSRHGTSRPPANLGSILGRTGKQLDRARIALGELCLLSQELVDRIGAAQHDPAGKLQDRQLARRIDRQEGSAPLPRALLDERRFDPELGKCQPNRAGERA
jgi:hypothetical protein